MIHELKILPKYFAAVQRGEKLFELRKNDRDFHVTDYVALNEYSEGKYTGDSMILQITYILDDPDVCKEGYVGMGLSQAFLYAGKVPLYKEELEGYEIKPLNVQRRLVLEIEAGGDSDA